MWQLMTVGETCTVTKIDFKDLAEGSFWNLCWFLKKWTSECFFAVVVGFEGRVFMMSGIFGNFKQFFEIYHKSKTKNKVSKK